MKRKEVEVNRRRIYVRALRRGKNFARYVIDNGIRARESGVNILGEPAIDIDRTMQKSGEAELRSRGMHCLPDWTRLKRRSYNPALAQTATLACWQSTLLESMYEVSSNCTTTTSYGEHHLTKGAPRHP